MLVPGLLGESKLLAGKNTNFMGICLLKGELVVLAYMDIFWT